MCACECVLYLNAYASTCVHECMCMHACMHVCMCMYVHECMCLCMYVYAWMYCMYACMYVLIQYVINQSVLKIRSAGIHINLLLSLVLYSIVVPYTSIGNVETIQYIMI